MRILLVICLSVMLSACVEFTTQICNSSNMVDVNGLEGVKRFPLFSSEDFEIHTEEVEIVRMGFGSYGDGQTEAFKTCNINGKILAVGPTDNNTYEATVIIPTQQGGHYMSNFAVGKSELDAAGIPYQLVERPVKNTYNVSDNIFNHFKRKLGLKNETETVMVIDNSAPLHSEYIVNNGTAMPIGGLFR